MKESLETVLYELSDGIATVTLNRPERMNALGKTMMSDLERVFFEFARRDEPRCVIVTGAGGRAFCAGADIKERAGTSPRSVATYLDLDRTRRLFRGIEQFERPTIAAIDGVALGGGLELALCCDLRIGSPAARLGLTELRLGAIPAAGGTQRLPRLIGEAKAKELLFLAEILPADEALRLGLLNRVVPSEQLLEEALGIARRIATLAPLATLFAKRAVNEGMQVGLDAGLEIERYAAAMLMETDDRKEGMSAFVEKRPARFVGH